MWLAIRSQLEYSKTMINSSKSRHNPLSSLLQQPKFKFSWTIKGKLISQLIPTMHSNLLLVASLSTEPLYPQLHRAFNRTFLTRVKWCKITNSSRTLKDILRCSRHKLIIIYIKYNNKSLKIMYKVLLHNMECSKTLKAVKISLRYISSLINPNLISLIRDSSKCLLRSTINSQTKFYHRSTPSNLYIRAHKMNHSRVVTRTAKLSSNSKFNFNNNTPRISCK